MIRANRKGLLTAAVVGAALAVTSLAAQPALADGHVAVRDFVLTNGIVNREPAGSMESFDVANDKAFVFARIKNDGSAANMAFIWYLNDIERARKSLSVGTSSGWRTWSSSAVRPGNWRVDLVDANGAVLAQITFDVGMEAAVSQSEMAPATSAVAPEPTVNMTNMNQDTGSGTMGSSGAQ